MPRPQPPDEPADLLGDDDDSELELPIDDDGLAEAEQAEPEYGDFWYEPDEQDD